MKKIICFLIGHDVTKKGCIRCGNTNICFGSLYDPYGGFGYHGDNRCEVCNYRGNELPHIRN